jgi:hypothetical protein
MGPALLVAVLLAVGASETRIVVRQPPGHVVYWVLPGERALDEATFGTPADPRFTAEIPPQTPSDVADLLRRWPLAIGVPVTMRATTPDGLHYTATAVPTPAGDRAIPVSGAFEVKLYDRIGLDRDGVRLDDTPDAALADLTFTDPDGRTYRVHPKHTVMPPFPRWETQGGVMRAALIHGDTGTGLPLLPRMWAYAAWWAVADITIDGRVVDRDKLVCLTTTQATRDETYRLVLGAELPLPPERTVTRARHHTRLQVLPVRVNERGVAYDPVHSAYRPHGGPTQDFIEVSFEQDEIVEGPPYTGP